MGKLRCVPKTRTMDREKYDELLTILREAQDASRDNNVFWDLEQNERPSEVRKEFFQVARKEGITLQIRHSRKSGCLIFIFENPPHEGRMSPDTYKRRVLSILKSKGRPMKKAEIVSQAGLPASVWSFRIRDLIDEGLVKREGSRRDAVYTLA